MTLIAIMIYTASIYLTQVTTARRLEGGLSEIDELLFKELYGTLPTTMLSLFEGMLGGKDWGILLEPLYREVSPIASFLLLSFILFTLLAVLNVITGNFVQTSLEGAEEVKQVHRFTQAKKMFAALDLDESGCISYKEIRSKSNTAAVCDFFKSMDMDAADARGLFTLLDIDHSGSIEFEEFLKGCMRIQGTALTADVLLLAQDFRSAFEKNWQALRSLEQSLNVFVMVAQNGSHNASLARESFAGKSFSAIGESLGSMPGTLEE